MSAYSSVTNANLLSLRDNLQRELEQHEATLAHYYTQQATPALVSNYPNTKALFGSEVVKLVKQNRHADLQKKLANIEKSTKSKLLSDAINDINAEITRRGLAAAP